MAPTKTLQIFDGGQNIASIDVFCDITIQGKLKLRGRGNLCNKEGKILHGASINKPRDTILVYDETSC
jgi:hypothetical protein